MLQDPQWMLEIEDGTELYTYYSMIKFNLQIRNGKRLTITNSKIEQL